MDDRDKDLTGLFVRDLDEIALPPRGAWRRAARGETIAMRSSRYLLTAGAVVAVLAIALIVGLQLRDRNTTAANPSASPTPSLTNVPSVVQPSSTANPNVTPTPSAASSPAGSTAPGGAIYNDEFGFIVTDVGGTASIRKESNNARIVSIDGQGIAVSPDGRQVAYFTADQLKVASAASPSSVVFSSSLSANEHGGAIAWSSDGNGLVYAVNTGQQTISSTVRTLDLRSGGPAQVVLTSTAAGVILQPIAWDRSANLAAVGETGEGGFMRTYDVINLSANPPTTTRFNVPVQIVMSSVKASS
ncbi:MAG: hypothetical protein M3O64_04240, partial [Chloroflexota bacterium]|nr:hypothetical protein [Chloroflexota bacterium]